MLHGGSITGVPIRNLVLEEALRTGEAAYMDCWVMCSPKRAQQLFTSATPLSLSSTGEPYCDMSTSRCSNPLRVTRRSLVCSRTTRNQLPLPAILALGRPRFPDSLGMFLLLLGKQGLWQGTGWHFPDNSSRTLSAAYSGSQERPVPWLSPLALPSMHSLSGLQACPSLKLWYDLDVELCLLTCLLVWVHAVSQGSGGTLGYTTLHYILCNISYKACAKHVSLFFTTVRFLSVTR